ncbi:hypothetical protein WN55_02647 [Dufourea novaeangliae]|uniref:Copia protein n=1 Tax=Dufourea novaeangliae TaxID=178035 RepID=A0A154PHS8_DUFNO|nr:hypothetical protein WN55_02647 [Dufourea novaeangliae]
MWQRLKSIYERDSLQQKYTLMQEFFEYKKKDETNIATFISDLKNLSFRLKGLGEEINEMMIISKVLTALPESYRYFISAWESSPATERTLTNLTARLLVEEGRNVKDREEVVAFKTEEKKTQK